MKVNADDEVLNDTIFYMRKRFSKGLYIDRKADFEVYLEKLKTINTKSYGKAKNNNNKKTS